MPALKTTVLLVGLFGATAIMAFDAGGDSESGYSNRNTRRFGRSDEEPDLLYDKGQAVYEKKRSMHGKFKYCIISPENGKHVKVKGKTLRWYDGSTYDHLAENIRNCDAPDESLADSFDKYDVNALLYYLKKRYKFSLKRS